MSLFSTQLHGKRIAIVVAILLPTMALADFGLFQLKHQVLIWANGGRWCADVDEVSGEVLAFHYGDAACDEAAVLHQT